ncbi:hypothetical protein AG1IA_07158 [Rhizoctonia solani AG-1 IA]|uniref:Uncharacterized protein n=1 Tax=Thanatephorus cucumeris (strain AG1-IA) TaxID=983506 RepID=L8WLL5_THACA|nr:hypothetical protein AG1IA_07158 [Rhizoctonia solani AG-1 IA]
MSHARIIRRQSVTFCLRISPTWPSTFRTQTSALASRRVSFRWWLCIAYTVTPSTAPAAVLASPTTTPKPAHHLQYSMSNDHSYAHQQQLHPPHPLPPPPQRHPGGAVPSSNVTSADSSDDEGELPTQGLVAPIEVLRGLAERQEREMGGRTRSASPVAGPSEPSTTRTGQRGSISKQGGSLGDREPEVDEPRPPKRRKTKHEDLQAPDHAFPDVVTKGIITEQEARELFAM